jgi:hypothetical protein
MQSNVLAKLTDRADLRAYVVWVPMSRGLERDVPNATREVPDARATHYWDGDGQLIKSYREVLGGFDEPVWDTYLLYGPEAKWQGDRPPAPLYWMHQLGSAKRPRVATGPFWDSASFLEKTRSLAR